MADEESGGPAMTISEKMGDKVNDRKINEEKMSEEMMNDKKMSEDTTMSEDKMRKDTMSEDKMIEDNVTDDEETEMSSQDQDGDDSGETTESEENGENGDEDNGDDDGCWTPTSRSPRSLSRRRRSRAVRSPARCREISPGFWRHFADPGLQHGYRILQEIMDASSDFVKPLKIKRNMLDYNLLVEKKTCLKEIQQCFEAEKYPTIKEFVMDVRLLLSNIYCYFRLGDQEVNAALKIEQFLEKKLRDLPKHLRDLCSLASTHGIVEDNNNISGTRTAGKNSLLQKAVTGVLEVTRKTWKADLMKLKEEASSKQALQVLRWEGETLLTPPEAKTDGMSLWELPSLGIMLQLISPVLGLDVPFFELERSIFMPESSTTLARLMTLLLSPFNHRAKLINVPPMPYQIWNQKLKLKMSVWFKQYLLKMTDTRQMFENEGIEEEFWEVMGKQGNESKDFHQLNVKQKLWVVKSLVENCVHRHPQLTNAVAESSWEWRCEDLGRDSQGRLYFHFPQLLTFPEPLACIRVYRKTPAVAATSQPETAGEDQYELVADSVDKLRSLVESTKDASPLSSRTVKRGLLGQLSSLLSDVSAVELVLERGALNLRSKMFSEWNDFNSRSPDSIGEAEVFWQSRLKKKSAQEQSSSTSDSKDNDTMSDANSNSTPARYSQRARTVRNYANFSEVSSDETKEKDELSSEAEELNKVPKQRGRKPGFRVVPKDSPGQADQTGRNLPTPIRKPETRPKRLTLKNGCLFVVLESEELIKLPTDSEGKIVVPSDISGLSELNRKSIEDLVAIGILKKNSGKPLSKSKTPQNLQTMPQGELQTPPQVELPTPPQRELNPPPLRKLITTPQGEPRTPPQKKFKVMPQMKLNPKPQVKPPGKLTTIKNKSIPQSQQHRSRSPEVIVISDDSDNDTAGPALLKKPRLESATTRTPSSNALWPKTTNKILSSIKSEAIGLPPQAKGYLVPLPIEKDIFNSYIFNLDDGGIILLQNKQLDVLKKELDGTLPKSTSYWEFH